MSDIEDVHINTIDPILDLIEKSYEVFYSKLTSADSYKYTPSQKDQILTLNFIEIINNRYGIHSVGLNFIFDYFVFQFDYWVNLDTMFGKKIPLSWFIGKKAFQRWLERPERDLFHAYQTASSHNLYKGLISPEQGTLNVQKLDEHEENEKGRFYNEPEGFVNCAETTTLYNHRSSSCMTCKWRLDCKKLLKQEYPKLYILRGYLKNEKNRIKKQISTKEQQTTPI